MHKKLIVILGPTATGKTSIAVNIANTFKCEIISADSRQIYKTMDIGTGKDLDEYKVKNSIIKYHLIDILDPSQDYSVYQFKKDFFNLYNSIKPVPVLCGGTGLYIESVLLNYQMSDVPPNEILRKKLDNYDKNKLINELMNLDSKLFDPSYHTTKRRLIRAIEIIYSKNKNKRMHYNLIENPLVIGMQVERLVLLQKIKKRLNLRLKKNMINEVERLIQSGLTLDRLKYFGLEYKIIGEHLFGLLNYDDMAAKLNIAINRFAKRQMTFFRRMEKRGIKINWINPNSIEEIELLVYNYINEL